MVVRKLNNGTRGVHELDKFPEVAVPDGRELRLDQLERSREQRQCQELLDLEMGAPLPAVRRHHDLLEYRVSSP